MKLLAPWVFGLATMLLAFAAAPSWAAEPESGHVIARRWCANCHLVDTQMQSAARDTAPSFPDIARRLGRDPQKLRGWLNSSHPSMPDMQLSREEIDDVVAYLQSLAP